MNPNTPALNAFEDWMKLQYPHGEPQDETTKLYRKALWLAFHAGYYAAMKKVTE